MAETARASARAVVTFDAPHGPTSALLHDGEVVDFGRGPSCRVRFGFAPLLDDGVPRVAGRLVVANQRVFVEVVDAPRRPSVQVVIPERPTVMIAVGDGFSPAEPAFRVTLRGTRREWRLGVRVRRERPEASPSGGAVPTRTYDVRFTPMQRKVLEAYLEPLTRGRREPATHREVAAALSYHPNSVREVLYDVWSLLFAADIPLPDISDKRQAVVEALRLHRLLAGET
jgi:hypothetical protein